RSEWWIVVLDEPLPARPVAKQARRIQWTTGDGLSFGVRRRRERNVFLVFEDRPSDSPFVERVWRSHSERAGTFHSVAACHWEMVVTRYQGKTCLTVRGPETKATTVDCPAEGDWVGIRFKLGTFMPLLPARDLSDRRDVTLPEVTSRSFWLNGSAWEYPDFENAETFVK